MPALFSWLFPVLITVIAVATLVWFVMMARLHRALRTRHAATYEMLGRPALFLNNSPQNGLATLRFLLGGKFRQLNDPELQRLGSFMQVLFYVHCSAFAAAVVIFLSVFAKWRA